jgi:RNA polymerase sigma-70 factor (ECF subfamily)
VRALSVFAASLVLQTECMAQRAAESLEPFRTVEGPRQASRTDQNFEDVVLPHLDAAYRVARWLTRSGHDAEDVVQEACLRALRYFRTFDGANARAWFLRIVRNTCHSWRIRAGQAQDDPFDEQQHTPPSMSDPEALAIHGDDTALVAQALKKVPERFRTLLVLRELEGLSYRELADVLDLPIGTVMSSLSRARQALRRVLLDEMKQRSGSDTRPSSVRPFRARVMCE